MRKQQGYKYKKKDITAQGLFCFNGLRPVLKDKRPKGARQSRKTGHKDCKTAGLARL
jgi:hypothetical protein